MARASPFELLLPELREPGSLLVADENLSAADFGALAPTTVVISNRCDVARAAERAGLSAHFNDFDFGALAPGSFERVCYRIAKERPVAHHVINRARGLLAAHGELVLVGGQREGIRTYADRAGAYLGAAPSIEKHGIWYRAQIGLGAGRAGADGAPLDDQDYTLLRPIARVGDRAIHSKPGLFGWDRIDRGSALLAEVLADRCAAARPASLLDLGCGYGYLALVAAGQGVPHIVATDNCAAALRACARNFAEFGVAGEVVAADCADGIAASFAAIACNPPFHRGFASDLGLTERFVAATARLLAPGGEALFVVQRGLPLGRLAANCALVADSLRGEGGFEAVRLTRAGRGRRPHLD